ncbi:glycosyltransferase family 4 protein [Porphyromonas sp.]
MRIAYVILNTWYAGGQTRVLTNKVNFLVDKGHEVYIVTSDQDGRTPYYPIDNRVHVEDLGLNYFTVDACSLGEKLMRLPRLFLKHRMRMQALFDRIQPDIVVSMFGKDVYVLPFVKTRAATILEAHGARSAWIFSRPGIKGAIQNWVDQRLIRRFDQFVVLTKEDLPNWDVPNRVCIPNGNSFPSPGSAPLDAKVAIAAGRYTVEKNFDSLVRAWAIVHAAHPDWLLRICGQSLQGLDPIINELGLADCIERKESNDMQQEYMAASISVVSSIHEGFSMALSEANSCGVPNVSYACQCGPRDLIIDGETGFLIEEVGNHELLAAAIIRLIEDEPLRKQMGKKAKEYSQLFSQEAVMARWEELFTQLIAKKRKG